MWVYIYKALQIDALHILVTDNSNIAECKIGHVVLRRKKVIVLILLFEFDTYY